jgi:fumarate hydratase subunit alpha
MREVPAAEITETISRLFIEANTLLGDDVLKAIDEAYDKEESPVAREVFEELRENARIAREEDVPICQDTGLAVVFVELGQDVRVIGGDLNEAIHEGVRKGYGEGYLRKSASHPLSRKNTGDNTPAIIHVEIVPGDNIRLIAAPKGGGSENMSGLAMLTPASGREGVIEYVVERIRQAGPNPCPPILVGVGIGGTFEKAAILAKKAIIRPIGTKNPDPDIAAMEAEILKKVNNLGIGAQGYGGLITALDVNIETFPCHIASLPVAVNVQCHASRHKEAVI